MVTITAARLAEIATIWWVFTMLRRTSPILNDASEGRTPCGPAFLLDRGAEESALRIAKRLRGEPVNRILAPFFSVRGRTCPIASDQRKSKRSAQPTPDSRQPLNRDAPRRAPAGGAAKALDVCCWS